MTLKQYANPSLKKQIYANIILLTIWPRVSKAHRGIFRQCRTAKLFEFWSRKKNNRGLNIDSGACAMCKLS